MTSTFDPDRARLGEQDYHLFNEGSHYRLYDKLGAHPATREGVAGTQFAVWAPGRGRRLRLRRLQRLGQGRPPGSTPRGRAGSGSGSSPGVGPGAAYKYHVHSRYNGYRVDKADPFAFFSEVPPKTASVVWDLDYDWGDAEWMTAPPPAQRAARPDQHLRGAPRVVDARPEEGDRLLSYRELAPRLAEHVKRLRVHPRRVHADHGAPVLRLVGVPDDRVLRRHQPVRHAAGPDVPDRLPAPERDRRDPRLGAQPLPVRRVRAGLLRRDAPVRALRPAAGVPPGLGELRSSTTAGTRCGRSCCPAPCSGWTSTTSTGCGSMPSPRCSTSTTPVRPASGCRTCTAGNENLDAIDFLRRFNEAVYREYPDVQTYRGGVDRLVAGVAGRRASAGWASG